MDHSIGLRPPVSETVYVQTLNLICGALLLAAVLILWRRELAAIVRLLVVQGVLLAALAALLGAREGSSELYAVAAGVLALKAVVLPAVLRRVLRDTGEARETEPLVNVAASLLAGALLTLLAYAVSRPLANARKVGANTLASVERAIRPNAGRANAGPERSVLAEGGELLYQWWQAHVVAPFWSVVSEARDVAGRVFDALRRAAGVATAEPTKPAVR